MNTTADAGATAYLPEPETEPRKLETQKGPDERGSGSDDDNGAF